MDVAALLLTEGTMLMNHLVAYCHPDLSKYDTWPEEVRNIFKKVPDVATIV